MERWRRRSVVGVVLGLALTVCADVRYVWKDNPNAPVHPYTSGWASAATNIQDAVDACVAGDTVLVTNGVYDSGARVAPGDAVMKTRVIVTNAVTVSSVNGPAGTLIVGQPDPSTTYDGLGDKAVRGAYLANGAVLSGFTVTNGFTQQTLSTLNVSCYGGGIRCSSTGETITNCVVVGNWAAMQGGGIYRGTVIDCQVLTNIVRSGSTSAAGGGMYSVTASQCLIENNVAKYYDGGGTYACVLDRCTLRGNRAGRNGGGACLSTLVSCTVESNSAALQGGGAYTPISVTNSLIRWNKAVGSGGGLYKGRVVDSVIASNAVTAANYYGGGFFGDSAVNDRLDRCAVVGNSAVTAGGGVYNAVLSNCLVQANRVIGNSAVSGNGGGYYASTDAGYYVVNTRFLDNEANYCGGGAYQGMFYNCSFSGNRAAKGGGAYLVSSSYQMKSCSVMGNVATNSYGGTLNGTIINSIVYGNGAPTYANYSSGTFSYSCADPLPSGSGNVDVDPMVSSYRDPHLMPGSPLIAAGVLESWMTGAVDMDGDPRSDGVTVDIGADQFSGSTLEGPLAVTVAASTNICAVGWPLELVAQADGRVQGLYWDFGDGGSDATNNPASHAFASPGVYTVTATVSNETDSATGIYEVTVIDPVIYASPTGGHVAPFDSWEKAATNLQDAVDAVFMPGGRVLATNGVYDAGARVASGQTVTNRLVLDKAVRVESVNGPEVTVILGRWNSAEAPLGTAAIRGVYVGGEATLCGFTVSNGATASATYSNSGRGGGLFLEAGGVATNCVVSGCYAWNGGGAASDIDAAGALQDCVLSGNVATNINSSYGLGGGAFGVNASSCVITSNMARNGGGAYGCVLTRCEVRENTATQGGGCYESDLDDCNVIANEANLGGGGAYFGTLNRCRVRDNVTSVGGGGGAYDATLTSCLIAGNTAYQGGGVYGASGTKGMINCTVISNSATVTGTFQGGGGFYGNGTSYPVRNCIVYYNASGALGTNLYQGAVTYTCSSPLPGGTGNMDSSPQLSDLVNGRLSVASPCINAGLEEAWMADALDLDDRARVEGTSVDMGAYEFAPAVGYSAMGTPLAWLQGYGLGPDYDADELADPDHDGLLTWQEYVAMTSPTNAASVFAVVEVKAVTNTVAVSFETSVGRVYSVQRSASLSPAAWSDASDPVAGTGDRMTVTVSEGAEPMFYRARVDLP